MSWVKDIISEHEKKEEGKAKQIKDDEETRQKHRAERYIEWESFIDGIIHPVLAEVEKELNGSSYQCTVKKVPYVDGRSGIKFTKEIILTTNMAKESPGVSSNQASIGFALSDDSSITVLSGPLKLFKGRDKVKISLSDNENTIKMILEEFLKKVYP